MLPPFDSRDLRYRSPFGAQPAGQAVFFRVCLPRELGCTACRLYVQRAAEDPAQDAAPGPEALQCSAMFWAGMEGDRREWWDVHYTPDTPGLYWYWFEMDTAQGRRALSRRPDGTGELAEGGDAPRWQLTCYDPAFRTPEWLAGGIFYQVFPDRFARSGAPKEGIPAGRVLREDWGGQPEWRPDEQGVVRNNDYFGGDLRGLESRLDRLAELGVTCLYLNPVFEAHSNHRYDTADYTRIDPLLGTEEDFRSLLRSAAQVGIRVLLDGVFSHTGADSVYFNKNGRYPGPGAYQTPDSPYFSWYHFDEWPEKYDAWWGFDTLPEVNENDLGFREYILGEGGVARARVRQGTAGWRLDVADELPDEFLDGLRRAVKAEDPDALLLGEVWEDASNKVSYGHRRRYLLGRQLDSVMNYPFRGAVLDFLRGGSAVDFFTRVMDVVENYPPQVLRGLMNSLGTHDTERALTVLAGEPADGRGREWQAAQALTPGQRERGLRRMRLASALQYTLPGVPCVYYGDEAGMEGYRDPFNRGCYPWGKEDGGLLHWYRRLGQLRRNCPALRQGDFRPLGGTDDALCYERAGDGSRLLCGVNAGQEGAAFRLPEAWRGATVSLGRGRVEGDTLFLPPEECALATLAGDGFAEK
ncbi:MAG TPA: glycoside hydrolase family 13 protein [Firmicutes bacterium]|nr:glycoside hydrolase family 13 protein [Bacillota bacterium]